MGVVVVVVVVVAVVDVVAVVPAINKSSKSQHHQESSKEPASGSLYMYSCHDGDNQKWYLDNNRPPGLESRFRGCQASM